MHAQEATPAGAHVFRAPFRKDHLHKTSQWVTLTRAAATAAVHDRVVEPWMATFATRAWRCEYIREAPEVRTPLTSQPLTETTPRCVSRRYCA